MIVKQLLAQSSLWLIPVIFLTRAMLPAVRQEPVRGYRRLFLFLVAGLFYSLLRGFWPVVTTQDYMPWMPLLPIFAVAGFTWAQGWIHNRFHVALPWLLAPALVLAGEVVWILNTEPVFTANERKRVLHLAEVLQLAAPGEYVLDAKGDTIYRPRPTYLVFETLTRGQLLSGRIQDDTVPNLVSKRVAVVRLSDRMMPDTKRFVEKNYVRVDGARVLGKRLATNARQPLTFEIAVPERYAFVGSKGPVSGTIDGQPINGPLTLEAGPHELVVTNHHGETTVIWARALERGFSPYMPIDSQGGE
jgi:hypothetical protein